MEESSPLPFSYHPPVLPVLPHSRRTQRRGFFALSPPDSLPSVFWFLFSFWVSLFFFFFFFPMRREGLFVFHDFAPHQSPLSASQVWGTASLISRWSCTLDVLSVHPNVDLQTSTFWAISLVQVLRALTVLRHHPRCAPSFLPSRHAFASIWCPRLRPFPYGCRCWGGCFRCGQTFSYSFVPPSLFFSSVHR